MDARTNPAQFKFGNGRMGEIRLVAHAPVGSAGCREKFATLLADADIRALLRKGAVGSLTGKLDFPHGCLHLRGRGAEVLLKANMARRDVLCVAPIDFGNVRPAPRGATQPVSRSIWDGEVLRIEMRNGGGCFPNLADGLYPSSARKHFGVGETAMLTDATEPSAAAKKGIDRIPR